MSLRFILGKAGSGKTTACLHEIIEAQSGNGGKPLIYIVPEQSSLYSEKSLLKASGGRGLMDARTLSFRRLAYYVFAETGGPGRKILEETGKNMLLRKVLMDLPGLKFFSRAADKPGFVSRLSQTISELSLYSISPEEMWQASSFVNESLAVKLRDLCHIFTAYREYMKDHYISGDDTPDLLAEKIKDSHVADGARIWIDGFHSFTPQEFAIIRELLKKAETVSVAMGLSSLKELEEEAQPFDTWYDTKATVKRLMEICRETNIDILSHQFIPGAKRWMKAPKLAYLAENYNHFNIKPCREPGEAVKLYFCRNLYDEVQNAADIVTRLVRDYGLTYKEIGLSCGDLEEYGKVLEPIFSQYGIPVFIDRKKDILSHPLTELIRSSVRIAANGMSFDNVFRLLKTGLSGLEREDVDKLENYCLAYGVKGTMWSREWTMGLETESPLYQKEELNALRLKVLDLVSPIVSSLGGQKRRKCAEIGKSLYQYLMAGDIPAQIGKLGEKALLSGYSEAYEEHKSIWGRIMELLDKICEILGEQDFTTGEFSKLMESGLAAVSLGQAPPSLDQLVAGDFHRSRLPEIKALIVLGANEGKIPGKVSESPIITEEDRASLAGGVKQMAPSIIERIYEEQRMVYAALSKASHYVFISCSLANTNGRELEPSPVMERLMEMFPDSPPFYPHRRDPSSIENITAPYPAFHNITGAIRGFAKTGEIPGVYKDAYAYFKNVSPYRERLIKTEALLEGLKGCLSLSPENLDRLYPGSGKITMSVSRLESYARCPFSYFARYNLMAKERKAYEVLSVDLGNIFHSVLERFATRLAMDGVEWKTAGDDLVQKALDRSLDEVFAAPGNEIFQYSGRYHFYAERIRAISKASVNALTEHMRRGGFDVEFNEVVLKVSENLGAGQISLPNGRVMEIEGRIDRVDVLRKNGETYIKLIDYKSGAQEFSFTQVFYSLQLQLLLYLYSFMQAYEKTAPEKDKIRILPAAVLYFRLQYPILSSKAEYSDPAGGRERERDLLKQFKMSGVVLSDQDILGELDGEMGKSSDLIPAGQTKDGYGPYALSPEDFRRLMEFAAGKAGEIAMGILGGDISVSPYQYRGGKSCDYCGFQSLCRLDALPENTTRSLKKLTEEQSLSEILRS